jgi:hypothetical protein
MLRRVAEAFARLGDVVGAPRCPECGGITEPRGEKLVHEMPPVIETEWRCRDCGGRVRRCYPWDTFH